MSDHTDTAADQFDEWLDADRRSRHGDDLSGFANRVMRTATLPETASMEPNRAQRDRMRERVFGGVPAQSKARTPVNTHAFAPNGSTSDTAAPTQLGPTAPPRASGLSILMTAAIVALIAVAGFGLLRDSIDFSLGGNDPNPTSAPGIAFSPGASPETAVSCDRSEWFGIFENTVPDILADTTHLTLDDGTLTLHCGGDIDVLATDVRHAVGAFWPGVIAMVMENDEVRLLNIASDTSLDLNGAPLLGENGELDFTNGFAWSGGPEPWIITVANVERTDWRVIDVRSMESFLLSDELGESFPKAHSPDIGHITGTDVAVVIWRAEDAYLSATPIEGGVRLPPDERALVLPGSIENRRWISIVDYRIQTSQRFGTSQHFSVNPDGSLLAYSTLSDTSEPVIRVEETIDGTHVVDVPIDDIDLDTKFILAGKNSPYLVYSNGETVSVFGIVPGATREIAELPAPDLTRFLPTADPDTILMSHNNSGTAVTPVNVATGEATERYQYVPSVIVQLFDNAELPTNIVRITSPSVTDMPATIQLVNPSTGEVVLESGPVDAHPLEIINERTFLREEGSLAVVAVGDDRVIVLDANSSEVWEIRAPVDDDRSWSFSPSPDGQFITAVNTAAFAVRSPQEAEYYIAPLEPGGEWMPLDRGSAAQVWHGKETPPADSDD